MPDLIAPHGGHLVNRLIEGSERGRIIGKIQWISRP